MKAFTVYQPYARAIVAGVKHYETRPRRTWRNWKFYARKRRSRNRPPLPLQSGKSISGGGSKTGSR